jgi:hypothetical protein
VSGHLTYPEALVIGALQGITELAGASVTVLTLP